MKMNIATILVALTLSFSTFADMGTVSLLNCERKTIKLEDGTDVSGYEYKGPSGEEIKERILAGYDVKKNSYFELLTVAAKVLQDIETEKNQYIATQWCELDGTLVTSPMSFILQAEGFISLKMKNTAPESPSWVKEFLKKARLETINNLDI